MKLITECLTEGVNLLSESNENGKKNHYIEGIMLQGGIPNRNRRIYPEKILEAATNKYIAEMVKNNRAYGELNHPQGPQINLDKVCHIVTELKKDGLDYYGKAIITNTPSGDIVRGLLESGAKLGVSSRGLGSIKPIKENLVEVQEDFHLVAIDVVADPSAPRAYINGIMENVDWVFNEANGEWIKQTQKHIHSLSKTQLEEQKIVLFKNFLKTL